jgi:hypothetical protein
MDIARRVLQLSIVCTITLAGTTFASAFDEGTLRIAMGPVSAPQKPGGTGADKSVTTCAQSDWSCPRLHRAAPHRRARAASRR